MNFTQFNLLEGILKKETREAKNRQALYYSLRKGSPGMYDVQDPKQEWRGVRVKAACNFCFPNVCLFFCLCCMYSATLPRNVLILSSFLSSFHLHIIFFHALSLTALFGSSSFISSIDCRFP